MTTSLFHLKCCSEHFSTKLQCVSTQKWEGAKDLQKVQKHIDTKHFNLLFINKLLQTSTKLNVMILNLGG